MFLVSTKRKETLQFNMKLFLVLACLAGSASAFSVENCDRRQMLKNGAAALFTGAAIVAPKDADALVYPMAEGGFKLGSKDSVVGREIRSFNGLIYNFKNTALDGGLDASKLNEPNVSFIEFGEKMKNGEVAFVEFIAPFGEKAYVTFKDKDGKKSEPIRIGELIIAY